MNSMNHVRRWALTLCLGLGMGVGMAQAAPEPTPDADTDVEVMRVAVKPATPFAFEEGGQWRGYSIELWTAIAQKNKWRFDWVPMETVPQTLEALQAGQVEVGVGALSITDERERILDFSHPFFESGLQIVTPAAATGSIMVALQGLLSAPVLAGLGVLFASLFLVSWLLWYLERRRNEESFPAQPVQGMKEAVWWSTNVLIAGGCENKAPVGTPGRLVAVVWMLGGIAFTSYITAVFTSTLTVTRLNTEVRGVTDLRGQLVATIEGSSSDVFLSKEGIPMEGHPDLGSAMGALLAQDVKAVVYDAPLIRHWLSTHVKEGQGLAMVGETFARQHYGFALPMNSEKRKLINEALLELRASGFLEDLESRWFGANDKASEP